MPALAALQLALARKAEAHADLVMPGFTHLQPAQPVTFGHHLLAYVEMLARDRGRFADARTRLNECPLGAAALAGTSFPIDRHADRGGARLRPADRQLARRRRPTATSRWRRWRRRPSAAMHLSRFAEEIVLWMTPQFGFVRLSDKFTTGSSIMPQKRNPDAAELVRAKVGRIAGAFQALLIVMKGLPLAYSKDMQEDKEATFDALASLRLAIAAMTGMVDDLRAQRRPPCRRPPAAAFPPPPTWPTGWCATLDLPFREAHHVTGRIVAAAEASGVPLDKLPLEVMQDVDPRITEDVFLGAFGAEFGQEPDQLWGNCATERPQNGASLDKAVGKGPRKGLEGLVSRPRSDRLLSEAVWRCGL